MMSHNSLRHRGHAHSITSDVAEIYILRRSLKGRALRAYIHTFHHADVVLLGYFLGAFDQRMGVHLMHIRETRTPLFFVVAAQRMLGEHVDVVVDDHQLANLEIGVHATGRVAQEQRLDAQLVHHADGVGYGLHVVALVVVETTLHGQYIHATQLAENQFAAVALDGGDRKIGDLLIGDLGTVSNLCGQVAEAGAQYNTYFGLCFHLTANKLSGCKYFF